jgi:hypothetical protein
VPVHKEKEGARERLARVQEKGTRELKNWTSSMFKGKEGTREQKSENSARAQEKEGNTGTKGPG